MKRLTAQRPILYGGRMYQAGDILPAYDKRMVEAWLSAQSAAMIDDTADEVVSPSFEADSSQSAAETPVYLARKQLESMDKDGLKHLAEDMGVDIPRGATRALILERLAAAVSSPADSGAQ